jgi:uncharacterized repeat protein (TIGR01451 family)
MTLKNTSGTSLSTITIAAADAESTNLNHSESISWGTSGPALSELQLIPNILNSTTGTCALSGTGTSSATCANSTINTEVGAYILDAVMPSGNTFTMSTYSTVSAKQGYAFAVDIAQLSAVKTLNGRSSASDQFAVTIKRGATSLASASTNGTGTSATTSLGVIPGDTFTLTDAAASGSLSNYVSTYACANAVSSSTTLPSGSGASLSITPAVDDQITCTFTNNALTLTDSASAEQYVAVPATVTDTFTLTNTSSVAGKFTIGTIGVSGSSSGTITPSGYVFGGTTYTTLTAAQSAITAAAATTANGSITFGVQYSAPATAQTISTTLAATVTSGSSASTSVSATATDDMVAAASGLQAQVDYNTVGLEWTAVSGASYTVYRGTTSGGETLLASVSAISSSSTYPIYNDLTTANGTTYYYEVTATVNGTQGARSPEVAATLPSFAGLTTTAYQLVASSSSVGTFSSDSGFVHSAGSPSSTGAAINTTSAISNPAPSAVYQTERFAAAFYYLLSGLQAGASYIVRIHEAELHFGTSSGVCTNSNCTGSRVFNVTINGVAALSSFDIWAEAGGVYTAIARDFTAAANSSGQIYIGFCSTSSLTTPTTCTAPGNGANNAKIDGIQIYSAPPALALTLSASTSTPVPGTNVIYTTSFTNSGSAPASSTIISTPVPSPTCFDVGTASQPAGSSGVSATITYSNNSGSTYAYTPVSGACGTASSGYDTTVTNIRWTFSAAVGATSSSNSGSVSFTVRVP